MQTPEFVTDAPYQHSHNAIERGDFVASLLWSAMSHNQRYALIDASVVNVLRHVLPRCGGRFVVACHAASALVYNSALLNSIGLSEEREDEFRDRFRAFDLVVFRAQDNPWTDPRLTRGRNVL